MNKILVFLAVALLVGICAHADRVTHHFQALERGETVRSAGEAGEVDFGTAPVLRMYFVDTGEGDCILIKCPGEDGKVIVVDCGTNSFYMGKSSDLPALAKGAGTVRAYTNKVLGTDNAQIDTLVLTHPHTDHYDLLPFVLGNHPVSQTLWVGDESQYGARALITKKKAATKSAPAWITSHCDAEPITLTEDDIDTEAASNWLPDCGGVKFRVLAADTGNDPNSRSIVLQVTFNKFDVILAGDGTGKTERAVLDQYNTGNRLDCEVLKVGHHGSDSNGSNGAPWLKALSPEVAIITAQYDYMYGLPTVEAKSRIEEYAVDAPAHKMLSWEKIPDPPKGRPSRKVDFEAHYKKGLYLTATNGNIVITTDGDKYNVEFGSQPPDTWRIPDSK